MRNVTYLLRCVLHLFRPFYTPLVPIVRARLVPDLEYGRLSFSQEGEDLVLNSLFEAFPPVARFYVDVGAYHPKRLSNTYFFYLRGWRGINIDAMPGSMKAFDRDRPRDINVECAISATPHKASYYMFREQALNTLDEKVARKRMSDVDNPLCQAEGTLTIEARTLTEVVAERLPPGQEIGFLNIDVEGLDLEVLRSLDFDKFSPQFILVETHSLAITPGEAGRAITYSLRNNGYRLVAMTSRTSIFLHGRCLHKWRE